MNHAQLALAVRDGRKTSDLKGSSMKNHWLVVAILLLTACSDDRPSSSNSTITEEMRVEYPQFATRFAAALTNGAYDEAHQMLNPELQKKHSAGELGQTFEAMVEYGSSPAKVDGFIETMEDWPDKKPDDVGWVYVSVSGVDYAEAVTVIVSTDRNGMSIRKIEWGRP
ncbi:MAG: hypothetical protein AAFN50_05480 [Pseudomonadota bacterium]